MITLTIFKPDGSVYFENYFDTKVKCDLWLKEESSRPYWNKKFSVKVSGEDRVDVKVTPSKSVSEAMEALRILKPGEIKTMDDVDHVVMSLIGAAGLK